MKLAFVRSYPIPNGSCSGNPVLCGASSLVLVGTIWMRYPLLCLSGAKLRLKMRPWNRCTPDNHCNYRQHAATEFENHCFSEKALLLCSVIQMNRCSLEYLNSLQKMAYEQIKKLNKKPYSVTKNQGRGCLGCCRENEGDASYTGFYLFDLQGITDNNDVICVFFQYQKKCHRLENSLWHD